jgi:hypothetical protein
MNVQPEAAFEAVIDTGETGLVDVLTLEISDNTSTSTSAPATAVLGLIAPDTAGQYTLIWKGAGDVLGIEDLFVTSSAPGAVPPADVYGSTDELFRRLKIRTPTAEQAAAADRILVAASGEVNAKMGRETGLAAWELALATEVTLERGAELWNESEVPFGVIGLDSPSGPTFVSRHSRALQKLTVLQESWGVG